ATSQLYTLSLHDALPISSLLVKLILNAVKFLKDISNFIFRYADPLIPELKNNIAFLFPDKNRQLFSIRHGILISVINQILKNTSKQHGICFKKIDLFNFIINFQRRIFQLVPVNDISSKIIQVNALGLYADSLIFDLGKREQLRHQIVQFIGFLIQY